METTFIMDKSLTANGSKMPYLMDIYLKSFQGNCKDIRGIQYGQFLFCSLIWFASKMNHVTGKNQIKIFMTNKCDYTSTSQFAGQLNLTAFLHVYPYKYLKLFVYPPKFTDCLYILIIFFFFNIYSAVWHPIQHHKETSSLNQNDSLSSRKNALF